MKIALVFLVFFNFWGEAFGHTALLKKCSSVTGNSLQVQQNLSSCNISPFGEFERGRIKASFSRSEMSWIDSAQNRPAGTPIIDIYSGMGMFEAAVGESHTQSYSVDGFFFDSFQVITVEVSALSGPFTVSFSKDSGFGSTLNITADVDGYFAQQIFVKYTPSGAGGHSATIDHSGGSISEALAVDGNATSLPVEWLSYTARVTKASIVLDWTTASEKNNSHFEVEIAKNPSAGFEKIGSVVSKVGNSKLPTRYRFTHYLGAETGTYYIRLKQVDIDHVFSYSELLAIEVSAMGREKLEIEMPNPIGGSSQLSVSVSEAGKLHMVILNLNGAEVFRKSYKLERGKHLIGLHLNNKLATGMYILVAELNGNISREKLYFEAFPHRP